MARDAEVRSRASWIAQAARPAWSSSQDSLRKKDKPQASSERGWLTRTLHWRRVAANARPLDLAYRQRRIDPGAFAWRRVLAALVLTCVFGLVVALLAGVVLIELFTVHFEHW